MMSQVQQTMLDKLLTQKGFIAALDQSGGSTPKALKMYGIDESAYRTDDDMFDLVHQMRVRIVTSRAFSGDRLLGAILFENTLDREIEGLPSATYLWSKKRVIPFLKVDKGLEAESDGVQLMKPIPNLAELLAKAVAQDVFGTKMRSVIKLANHKGIKAIVEQQFELSQAILATGLTPVIEPEVDINSPDKAEAEALLKLEILAQLNRLNHDQHVILKVTLPTHSNFYKELVDHPKVIKVLALSGGYHREEANAKLAENQGVIASYSRALIEAVSSQQSQDEFDDALDKAVDAIFTASKT